jgi:hypothetical protein
MPYTLTLTHDERQAIDWVGYRYPCGDEFRKLLTNSRVSSDTPEDIESGVGYWLSGWESNQDITYSIPESIAWGINDLLGEPGSIACFEPSFVSKLWEFMERIV